MPQESSEIPADIEKIKTALRNAGVLRDDEETRSKLSAELSRQGAHAIEHKIICSRNHWCIVVKE